MASGAGRYAKAEVTDVIQSVKDLKTELPEAYKEIKDPEKWRQALPTAEANIKHLLDVTQHSDIYQAIQSRDYSKLRKEVQAGFTYGESLIFKVWEAAKTLPPEKQGDAIGYAAAFTFAMLATGGEGAAGKEAKLAADLEKVGIKGASLDGIKVEAEKIADKKSISAFVGGGIPGGLGSGSGKKIALGLGDDLQKFASSRGAIPYWNWTGTVTRRSTAEGAFGRAFTDAARNAEEIHFNLTGINSLPEAYKLGRGGYEYTASGADGVRISNATNTELTTIVRDAALLKKTSFWRDGQKVETSAVLKEIGIDAP